MSGQVYVVDNMHVIAATEKLARFKIQKNLQIQIDSDVSTSECSTLTATSREDEPPTPTSCRHEDDAMGGDEEPTCEKKKRRRRTAAQIDRKYVCTYAGCKKAYGSEGSLTQHMRLKHRSLTLSHRDRVVSTFYAPNGNNIAIRPAINFVMDMSAYSPPTQPFLGNESDLPPFGLEKLRLRSNSMPSDGYNNQQMHTDTPRWLRKKTTPQSARAHKIKTTTPRQTAKGKIKRSLSSPCGTSLHTPDPSTLLPSCDPTSINVDDLKLSYLPTTIPQPQDPYPYGKELTILNSLDWDGVKEEQRNADMTGVLQALVEQEPVIHTEESFSTPTSPPLYAEFPMDDEDTDMLSNQYDNDVYYKQPSPVTATPPPPPSTLPAPMAAINPWEQAAIDMEMATFPFDSFNRQASFFARDGNPAAVEPSATFYM
ncbi:unnamed protein product [Aphanomyces euteiches]